MPRPTRTLTGDKARQAIRDGVNAIYEPVRVTFGPEGRNSLLYRTMNRGERITNDGVTVAQCQEPQNPFVRMVAHAFRETCKRTNERVGDGTTCTTILGGTLYNSIFAELDSNESLLGSSSKKGAMALRKEILEAAETVKDEIKKSSKEIKTLKDLEHVATVSVEDPELGKIIAEMAWEVGTDGFIDVVEGYKGVIETEVNKGMRFAAKTAAKVFVNKPERFEMVAEDCPILLTNYSMDNVGEFVRSFNEINKTTSKLIVAAPSFSENVLVNFANAMKQGFYIYPVKIPSLRTDQLEDLAVYCDAKFIDKAKGLELQNVRPADLGFIEKLVVKDTELKEDAVITGGRGTVNMENPVVEGEEGLETETPQTRVQKRLETLKGQLEETKQENFKKLLERRIASMASAVGVIRVGDSTQASSLYRKLKIEDAVYACKAALRGGYVAGGGMCLKTIAEKLPEDSILRPALLAPYEQIQSSVEGGIEIGKDVIDPTESIYYAVEHATQVVANLITVDNITAEVDDPMPGEGEFAIAKALMELVISDKINKGQLKEGKEEAYRDSLGGFNDDEFAYLNRD